MLKLLEKIPFINRFILTPTPELKAPQLRLLAKPKYIIALPLDGDFTKLYEFIERKNKDEFLIYRDSSLNKKDIKLYIIKAENIDNINSDEALNDKFKNENYEVYELKNLPNFLKTLEEKIHGKDIQLNQIISENKRASIEELSKQQATTMKDIHICHAGCEHAKAAKVSNDDRTNFGNNVLETLGQLKTSPQATSSTEHKSISLQSNRISELRDFISFLKNKEWDCATHKELIENRDKVFIISKGSNRNNNFLILVADKTSTGFNIREYSFGDYLVNPEPKLLNSQFLLKKSLDEKFHNNKVIDPRDITKSLDVFEKDGYFDQEDLKLKTFQSELESSIEENDKEKFKEIFHQILDLRRDSENKAELPESSRSSELIAHAANFIKGFKNQAKLYLKDFADNNSNVSVKVRGRVKDSKKLENDVNNKINLTQNANLLSEFARIDLNTLGDSQEESNKVKRELEQSDEKSKKFARELATVPEFMNSYVKNESGVKQSWYLDPSTSSGTNSTEINQVAGIALTGQHTILPDNYLQANSSFKNKTQESYKESYKEIHQAMDEFEKLDRKEALFNDEVAEPHANSDSSSIETSSESDSAQSPENN